MKRLGRVLAAAGAGLLLAASPARSQTLFTGSGCSGDQFMFCASWTLAYLDGMHLSLFITNTSQNAPANNTSSAITKIAIGNLTFADPTSIDAVGGWQYAANVNGFNGFGLLENQFGIVTSNGITNALVDGTSQTFTFSFGSDLGTFSNVQSAVSGAQIALHDQGTPITCGNSKVVFVGSAPAQNLAIADCDALGTTSTAVPEPSTYALIGAGLVALYVAARRRRAA